MRCKPPCLAWLNNSMLPENKNRIVSVQKESKVVNGVHNWLITCGEKVRGISYDDNVTIVEGDSAWAPDAWLTPINDGDLDTRDVGEHKPMDVVEKKDDIRKWEFPEV